MGDATRRRRLPSAPTTASSRSGGRRTARSRCARRPMVIPPETVGAGLASWACPQQSGPPRALRTESQRPGRGSKPPLHRPHHRARNLGDATRLTIGYGEPGERTEDPSPRTGRRSITRPRTKYPAGHRGLKPTGHLFLPPTCRTPRGSWGRPMRLLSSGSSVLPHGQWPQIGTTKI